MGDYYVPNIQRPGFGYKRRGDDDDEWGGDDSPDMGASGATEPEADTSGALFTPYALGRQLNQPSSGTPASDGGAVKTPDYWPGGAAWNQPQQSNNGAYWRGPNDIPLPNQQSGADNYPSDTGVPGVGSPPMPAPERLPPPVSPIKPYKPGPQQEALKTMTEVGPKRSILGTILAGAAGAAAGWVNAGGRTRPVAVPTQAMRNMTWRAPKEMGGGAWDTRIARQRELAQQEQGEEQRALTSQQIQAQEQERMAQADYYRSRGKYDEEQADTNRQYREDQVKNARLQRILQLGGKGGPTETREIPPGGKPPAGPEWYIAPDPLNPGYRIAVRPSRGDEIDAESAKRMHLAPDSEGKYHATPTMINTAMRTQELSEAAAARTAAAAAERQRREDQHAEDLAVRKDRNAVLAGDAEDRKARAAATLRDAEQRTSDSIDQARNNLLNSAVTWRNNELDRLKRDGPALGKKAEQEEAEIQREWLRRSQSAYDQWGDAIRRRPGHTAADFKFYPNGSVVQASEPYGAGGKAVPVGSGGPPPPPAPPTASTGGGRGGRGGANLPPRVATPQNKTMSKAEVQAYADTTKTDYATAAKVFTDRNFTITP